MASKCQRGESSRAARAYSHDKFKSLEALDYYHNVSIGKTFVLERDLRPGEEDGELTVMIVEREFYTNVKEMQNNVVQVRSVPLFKCHQCLLSYTEYSR